jgi:MFS transporter, MHS family, proline/betaine transporter
MVRVITPAELRRVVVASILGNGLEWFDFFAYGYFAQIIAHVFFPTQSDVLALVLTYSTFAIGFGLRPLGGILLGIYADRAGRRRALSLLILMMAAGTLLMGITPGYAAIGVAAPLIVLVGRVLQGLSAGGEFAAGTALLVEYAPPGKKMLFGSFQFSAQFGGAILASALSYLLTTHLTPAALNGWGWRVPFLLGSLVGPIGFYIRNRIADSPEFERVAASPERVDRLPISTYLRRYGPAIFGGMGVLIMGTANNYLYNAYFPVYAVRQLHLPLSVPLLGSFLGSCLIFVLCPFFGILADRIGPFRILFPTAVLMIAVPFPLFSFFNAHPNPLAIICGQIVGTSFQAATGGCNGGVLAGIFSTGARTTSMSISYNVASLLFGGLGPLYVTSLVSSTGNNLVPAYYLVFTALVSMSMMWLTGIYRMRFDGGTAT